MKGQPTSCELKGRSAREVTVNVATADQNGLSETPLENLNGLLLEDTGLRPTGTPGDEAVRHSWPARNALMMTYLTPHLWNGTMKNR